MAEIRKGKKQLGQYLVEKGCITPDQLKVAFEEQRKTGLFLREVFLKLDFVTEDEIISFFEEELNIATVQLSDYTVDPEIIDLIPEKLARRFRLVPLFRIRNTLTVAMEDPMNVNAIEAINSVTGLDVGPCICSKEDITFALQRYYRKINHFDMFNEETAGEKLQISEMDEKIGMFVKNIFEKAVTDKAADIHFEPDESCLRVRLRIDGILKELITQPLYIHPAVIKRIKILSELDTSEKRIPQEGRIRMQDENSSLNLRVSTFPTVHGENVVIHLHDYTRATWILDDIGLDNRDLVTFRNMISKPNGLILVVGPSGSGKTTTLYSLLQTINTIDRNIMTLEDPVEYFLPLIRQTQINEDIGLTYAKGIRSMVRQEPDVILLGEIRDSETARIAIHAALTGHLVLSTVETNDSFAAIARLWDMEIDPFLFSSSLLGVVSQRLLQKVCPQCVERYELPESIKEEIDSHYIEEKRWSRGKGCVNCGGTGYDGKCAIFEVLEITKTLRTVILEKTSLKRIKNIAVANGHRTIREDGIKKASAGKITIEEVLRITDRVSEISPKSVEHSSTGTTNE